MTREKAEYYDSILEELSDDGSFNDVGYEDDDSEESIIMQKAYQYFKSLGFVKLHEAAGGGIFGVNLLAPGVRFKHEGGFVNSYEESVKEIQHKQLEQQGIISAMKEAKASRRLSIIALIVSALSLLAQIITSLLT
ncbi:hypothetical protein GCM10023149_49000 [Mucilaginibacter gynuensis]|uniref:Transcriptional regulator n=1 Tax=Mucilaginibacter gynuensis TaxID=1302236 RepID=A0ABP8HFU2_9SPHI